MQIVVRVKMVYGEQKVYPVCDTAMRLVELAGAKTLTPNAIRLIKELGYTIKVQQDEIEL